MRRVFYLLAALLLSLSLISCGARGMLSEASAASASDERSASKPETGVSTELLPSEVSAAPVEREKLEDFEGDYLLLRPAEGSQSTVYQQFLESDGMLAILTAGGETHAYPWGFTEHYALFDGQDEVGNWLAAVKYR